MIFSDINMAETKALEDKSGELVVLSDLGILIHTHGSQLRDLSGQDGGKS